MNAECPAHRARQQRSRRRHTDELVPRLDGGMLEGLMADVLSLRDAAAGVTSSRADRKSATLDQGTALRGGAQAARAAVAFDPCVEFEIDSVRATEPAHA